MIVILARHFVQRHKAGIPLPPQLKDLTKSPLLRDGLKEHYQAEQRRAPPMLLSEAISPETQPKKLPRKTVDLAKLGKSVRKGYLKIIDSKFEEVAQQAKEEGRELLEARPRDYLQNKMNHQEWALFKQEEYQTKERLRLLNAEARNPLNYLPNNASEQALRFQQDQAGRKQLADIRLRLLQQASQPNLQLGRLIASGESQSSVQPKREEGALAIMQRREAYKDWLMTQKYKHLSYQARGRLELRHFSQPQLREFWWRDVKGPGELLHALRTNEVSVGQMSAALLRLSGFEMSKAELTRLQLTMSYRRLLRRVFSNLNQLSSRELVEAVHALGSLHQHNQGLNIPRSLGKALFAIEQQLDQRKDLSPQDMAMLCGPILKLPVSKQLTLQSKVLQRLIDCQHLLTETFFIQEALEFVSACDRSLGELALPTAVQLAERLIDCSDWHLRSVVTLARGLAFIAGQNKLSDELKQKAKNRLHSIPKHVAQKFGMNEVLELSVLAAGTAVVPKSLLDIVCRTLARRLRQRQDDLHPEKVARTVSALAQIQLAKEGLSLSAAQVGLLLHFPRLVASESSLRLLHLAESQQFMELQSKELSLRAYSHSVMALSSIGVLRSQLSEAMMLQVLEKVREQPAFLKLQALSHLFMAWVMQRNHFNLLPRYLDLLEQVCAQLSHQTCAGHLPLACILAGACCFWKELPPLLVMILTAVVKERELLPSSLRVSLMFSLSHYPNCKEEMALLDPKVNLTSNEQLLRSLALFDRKAVFEQAELVQDLTQKVALRQQAQGQVFGYFFTRQQVAQQMGRCEVLGPCLLSQDRCVTISSFGMEDCFWKRLSSVAAGGRAHSQVFAPSWGR